MLLRRRRRMTYTDHSLLDLTDKEKLVTLGPADRCHGPSDKQPDSVVDIRAAAETLPIPADMPIEDLCSLTSRALRSPFTTTVPASTEDVLIKGFHMLDLENERIETAQQSELVDLSESMQQQQHSFFNELENINPKLNPPTLSVNSEGFIPMLLKLDDCIEYVSSHPNFKDYPVYLAKFQQCLTKAMHFMKTHTVNTMQNLTSQLAKRDPLGLTNADNAFTLCYVKFRAAAPKVRMLIEQMEQRSERILEFMYCMIMPYQDHLTYCGA